MTEARSAREAAALALFEVDERGAWSEAALHGQIEAAGLSARDAALAARLVYGTLQNAALLDWYLRQFSHIRLKKIAPRVRTCLRLGLYQLILLDKIPAHAAVSQTVSLVRSYADARAAGFATGVLRGAAQAVEQNKLPRLDCPDKPSYYALRYSLPEWLTKRLCAQLGEKQAGAFCAACNQLAPTSVRVNLLRGTAEQASEELTAAGLKVEPHPKAPEILLCTGGDVSRLPAFLQGRITVQDAASLVAAAAADPKPDQAVLDCCAAPGGKSFVLAEKMQNQGALVSCDIYAHKLDKIRAGAERLGLSIVQPTLQSAAEYRAAWQEKFDVVLCDVPCSGFGILRKKPEIRNRTEQQAAALPPLQAEILQNCARYVKKGGTLVYSTCTILDEENRAVVQNFLAQSKDFAAEPWTHPVCGRAEDGTMLLLPHLHQTDGFFIAKMRKRI